MKERTNFYIDCELIEWMKQYKDKTGIPHTRVIEDALRDYIVKNDMVNEMAKQEGDK